MELLYLLPFSVTEHKEQNYGKSELLKHIKNKNPCTLLLASVDIPIVVNPLTSLSSNTYRYTLVSLCFSCLWFPCMCDVVSWSFMVIIDDFLFIMKYQIDRRKGPSLKVFSKQV